MYLVLQNLSLLNVTLVVVVVVVVVVLFCFVFCILYRTYSFSPSCTERVFRFGRTECNMLLASIYSF